MPTNEKDAAPKDTTPKERKRFDWGAAWGVVRKWMRRVLMPALFAAIIAVICWNDTSTEANKIAELEYRGFTDVVVATDAHNYGKVPLVNAEGTYYGTIDKCRFTIWFDNDMPKADVQMPNGTKYQINDIDRTRVAFAPDDVRTMCLLL